MVDLLPRLAGQGHLQPVVMVGKQNHQQEGQGNLLVQRGNLLLGAQFKRIPLQGNNPAYTPGREDTLQLDTTPSGRYAEAIAGAVANVLRERLPPVSVPSPSARTKFSPPTLFQDVRSRRGRKKQASKLVSYVRDIILLPMEFRSRDGEISIPRSSRRNKLGKAGLVGKIEIDSTMTDSDVRREVCEVFAVPMGLSESDIGKNHPFPFTYLQRAGAGSRSLCLPSVKASFQWNGRQVASLAKSGSFIYLLAEAELPGYQSAVSLEAYTGFSL